VLRAGVADDDYDDDDGEYEEEEEEEPIYQRKSKQFHLTRILLKFVAALAQTGEISRDSKSKLKDWIVDQEPQVLQIAEDFDQEGDIDYFKFALIELVERYS